MMYLIVRGESSVVAVCDSLESAVVFGVHSLCVDGEGVSIRTLDPQDGGGWVENSKYFGAITKEHVWDYMRNKHHRDYL